MDSARPRPRPAELLQQSWSSVYTTPQTSRNQVGYVNATANVNVTPTWSLQGNAYLRSFFQRTVDGNRHERRSPAPESGAALLQRQRSTRPPTGSTEPLANPFSAPRRSARSTARRTQTTSVGNDVAGDQHRQAVRPRQPLRRSARSFDYGVTNFGASAELGDDPAQFHRRRLRHLPRPLRRSGRRRPGFAARDQRLHRPLSPLDTFDVTEDARLHGRRPAQCRQYPPAGSTRHVAQRRRHVHALQPDDRRDLQDRRRRHRLCRLFRGQSRADAAGARLRRPRSPLHPRELPRLRSAAEAGRCATSKRACAARTIIGETSGRSAGGSAPIAPTRPNDILNVADPVQQGFGYFRTSARRGGKASRRKSTYKTDKYRCQPTTPISTRRSSTLSRSAPTRPTPTPTGHDPGRPGDQIPMIPHHRFKLGGRLLGDPELQDRRRLARGRARNIMPATPPTRSRNFPATPWSTSTPPIR